MAYDYGGEHGPHTWILEFPEAGGKQQSPINLITSIMTYDQSLGALELMDKEVTKETIIKKAHNFEVAIEGNGVLRGGPLQTEYKLVQFHFHWGSGNTWGSEHLVNGVSSPAELHCVFINPAYGTALEAIKHPDGLAVLGAFMQLGKDKNVTFAHLVDQLAEMQTGEHKVLYPQMQLSDLLPRNLSRYYTYSGSLTTPPCSECVTWIVLDEAIVISLDQLDKLRKMHDGCSVCGRTDNYRPICPIGQRRIRCSFPMCIAGCGCHREQ